MKLKKFIILLFTILISFSFIGCQEEYTNEQNMEAVEKYPELIKLEKNLKKKFPFPKDKQECIRFDLSEYEDENYIHVQLSFKETVTKKQLVEALQYTAKEIKSFSDDNISMDGLISYTEDETFSGTKGFMEVFYTNGAEKGSWEIVKIPSNKRESFDPDDVEEGKAIEYFEN